MILINERDRILNVSKRWDMQYPSSSYPADSDKAIIGAKLRAIDLKSASAKEIADIIGNDSWTHAHCFACQKRVSETVFMGDSESGEDVCRACITEAAALL